MYSAPHELVYVPFSLAGHLGFGPVGGFFEGAAVHWQSYGVSEIVVVTVTV